MLGYGIFMAAGPNKFPFHGGNLQITFAPATPVQENGLFENGKMDTGGYPGSTIPCCATIMSP
jgi:hypothetical protein